MFHFTSGVVNKFFHVITFLNKSEVQSILGISHKKVVAEFCVKFKYWVNVKIKFSKSIS